MHTWAQMLILSPNTRPYFLSDEELIWANPQLAGKIPNNLLESFFYFRKLLQAESPEHLKIITQTSTTHDPRTTPITNRWQIILAASLSNLPPGPTPLQLLLSSKQLDITTILDRRAALITQTHLTIPRPPPIHVSINHRPNKLTKINTHTTHPLSPSQAHKHKTISPSSTKPQLLVSYNKDWKNTPVAAQDQAELLHT